MKQRLGQRDGAWLAEETVQRGSHNWAAKRVVRKKTRCREDLVVIPGRQRKKREGIEIAVKGKKSLSQKELSQ